MKYRKITFPFFITLTFFSIIPAHACFPSLIKALISHCLPHPKKTSYYAWFCDANIHYQKDMDLSLARAYQHLDAITPRDNSVIIMDIDKTAIVNFTEPNIPVLSFYNHFLSRNFKFIFLTTRPNIDSEKTLSILKLAGYHTIFHLMCMPDDLYFSQTPPQTNWKYEQRKNLSHLYSIEATLDDNPDWLCGEQENTGFPILIPDQDFYAQPYRMSYNELYQRALSECMVAN